jgi:hypothetical protein
LCEREKCGAAAHTKKGSTLNLNRNQKALTLVALAVFVFIIFIGPMIYKWDSWIQPVRLVNFNASPNELWGGVWLSPDALELLTLAVVYTGLFFVLQTRTK